MTEKININRTEDIKVELAKAGMKMALKRLRDAWSLCVESFSDANIDCNDYILGDKECGDEYPFQQSFDEINVIGWIDGCLERMNHNKELPATHKLTDEEQER